MPAKDMKVSKDRYANTIPSIDSPEAPAHVDAKILTTASTSYAYTIPAGVSFLRLTGTNPFWYKFGGVAAIPASDVADGTASTLVMFPVLVQVPPGATSIQFISVTALAAVCIEAWN
jgi:hypothetical protein